MKKIYVVIMFLMIAGSIFAQSYSGGSGTLGDPYLVANKTDLKYLSEHSNHWNKHFKQTENIIFEDSDFQDGGDFYNGGAGFIPIGNSSSYFGDNNSYNGDGHIITGLYINRSSTEYVGLFGNTQHTTISNLGLTNVIIYGQKYVGPLVGYNSYSTIENCYCEGKVYARERAGGLVGDNSWSCTISNSFAYCRVQRSSGSSYTSIGAFLGYNYDSTVEYSYTIGDVIYEGTTDPTDKGFVGGGSAGTFNSNFFDSEESNQSTATGATAKTSNQMKTESTFTGASPSWDFTNTWIMSSVITYNAYPTLQWTEGYAEEPSQSKTTYEIANLNNLVWIAENSGRWADDYEQTVNIDASASVGWDEGQGWTPIGDGTTYFSGSYDGQDHYIDGLYIDRNEVNYVGFLGRGNDQEVHNLGITNITIADAELYVGAVIGSTTASFTISNCYSTGSIIGINYVGGIVGDATASLSFSPTFNGCYSTCSVAGNLYVGGCCGRMYDFVTLRESFSSGDVTGETYVGGLTGYIQANSQIRNCYSRSNVSRISGSGSASIGAMCGYIENAVIYHSYSTGNVTYINATDPTTKGFVASDGGSTLFTDNFWDSEVSNQSTGWGATAEDTDDMTNATATNNIYLDAGWDFKGESTNGSDDIWNIGNGRNNGYPYFDWEYPSDPGTLPVVLSTFTAQYIQNTPTIHWSTQSETDNMGWFVYRNEENDFTTSEKISEFIEGYGTTTQQQFYTYEDRIQEPEVGDTYYYWLESVDYSGMIHHYNKVAILTIPDNGNSGSAVITEPERFGLFQNEPNPLIFSTRIAFNFKEAAKIDLAIYNLKGQLVKKLYSGVTSKHTVMWDGKDENGKELENGVYFYKLVIDGKTEETKKLILMR